MRKRLLPFVVLTFPALTGHSNASEVDTLLSKAKEEGKVVMLELGSVGCIPCEQMKPVMEKLREKINLIHLDIPK